MEKQIYLVKKIKDEAVGVKTICFAPKDGKKMMYRAGQFLRVALVDNPNNLASKPYSISSAPAEECVAISVKKVGPFSSALHELKTGDEVEISGPFGSMVLRDEMERIVFVAGGIGIAPFFSMIKEVCGGGAQKEIDIFYSNKTKAHIAFERELSALATQHANFRVVHFLTQEDGAAPQTEKSERSRGAESVYFEQGRINQSALKTYLSDISTPHFFLCGTVGFVNDMAQMLKNAGIAEGRIFAELFY